MFAESTLFFPQCQKKIYFLRGSLLQSDMATLTIDFEYSFSYATIFLFTLQFSKISRTDIQLSDKNKSSFSLVEKKKKDANEAKRYLIGIFTFLNTIETL